jgi:hypothetical protein
MSAGAAAAVRSACVDGLPGRVAGACVAACVVAGFAAAAVGAGAASIVRATAGCCTCVSSEVGSQPVEPAEEFALTTAELSYLPDRKQRLSRPRLAAPKPRSGEGG